MFSEINAEDQLFIEIEINSQQTCSNSTIGIPGKCIVVNYIRRKVTC